MGDIRSGNGDPDKWDRDKPVVTAQQATRASLPNMYDSISAHMLRSMNKSIFGRWRQMDANRCSYLVFDKRTKDYEECTGQEAAQGTIEAWLDQGAHMEDIVVYDVDAVFSVKPSPGFKLEIEQIPNDPGPA